MKTSPLKIARTKRGLTQGELSGQVRIPVWKLSMYEGGVLKLKDTELERLKKALGSDFSNPEF